MPTRVKFCGITNPKDAVLAAQLGVDAIGLVFYEKSPRYISISQAQEIIHVLPPFVTTVGLFVDAKAEEIQQILQDVPIDIIQFHGNETAEFCRQINKVYIKAIRMRDGVNLTELALAYHEAKALLLDAYVPGTAGGSGQQFNWQLIPDNLPKPIILAGGLSVNNVKQAIQSVHPFAVDVSSGIELTKREKDREKMQKFIDKVKSLGNSY